MVKQKLKQFFLLAVAMATAFFIVRFIDAHNLFTSTLLADFEAKRPLFVGQGEFAELLADLKELPETYDESCLDGFKDDDRYTRKICAIKNEGWLAGITQENQFREKKLLKMKDFVGLICRAYGWTNKENPHYKSCLKEAKDRGFLAAINKTKNPFYGIRREEVTRFMEILTGVADMPEEFRESAQDTEINGKDITQSGSSKKTEEIFAPFMPVAASMIDKSFFDTVQLETDFSNTFYRHEIFVLKGEIVSAETFDQVFAFLIPKDGDSKDTINYIAEVKNRKFEIPVIFRYPGNYQLGIIPGLSGKSKVAEISVLNASPEPSGGLSTAPEVTQGLDWNYKEGDLRFHFQNKIGDFVRLTFAQNNRKIQYFSRSFVSEIIPETVDFEYFDPGQTEVKLEFAYGDRGAAYFRVKSPWAQAAKKTVTLIERPYRDINEAVTITKFDEFITNGSSSAFEGKASVPIATEGAYTDPSGEVQTFAIPEGGVKDEIAANTDFKIQLSLPEGTTIFEINDPDGAAIVNAPVFAHSKNNLPLLPDYFALNTPERDPAPLKTGDLTAARLEMLNLVNATRKALRRNSMRLDNTLNPLAQNHCKDMKERNYFSHVNPEDKGPNDRRITLGIDTPVKENLAKSPTLEFGHEGLKRSPVHLKTILDREVTRVGMGIIKDSEGYYLICEEFAPDSLTEEDLRKFESDFLAKANSRRFAAGIPHFLKNADLADQAIKWSKKMSDENFFGFQNAAGEKLIDVIRNAGIKFTVQSHIVESGDPDNLETEFLSQSPVLDGSFTELGMGLAKDQTGILKLTVIYKK